MVEQHVGVGPAVAGAVGAAALAGVLIHVEPAVAKGLLKHCLLYTSTAGRRSLRGKNWCFRDKLTLRTFCCTAL